jgi:type IV pilus assembly protein PilY1
MEPNLKSIFSRKFVQSLLVVASLFVSAELLAATVSIATSPLVSSTTTTVLPNLMYILDDSGSMKSDYMPDYVNDSNKCKSTGTTGDFSATCQLGDPPYNTKEFNTLYYNPAITYSPPVTSAGVSYDSMNSAKTTGWTIVPVDAYGTYSTANTRLVPNAAQTAGYVDRVWCNTASASTADLINPLVCKKNSQYIYPTNTGTTSTSFNQPYTMYGHPYYYTVSNGEYCTNANLTNCITATAPDTTHTFPAKLRWCNSAARTNCQAKYLDSSYTYAKWSGLGTGTSATGSIKIKADPAGAAPGTMSIAGIKVDGISIIPTTPSPALTITDTTNNTARNTLASNIATAINAFTAVAPNPEFTATAVGNLVTITNPATGVFSGTITVTTSAPLPTTTTAGAKAVGSITFSRARNTTAMGSLSVGSVVIMSPSVSTTASDNTTDLATKVKNNINSFVSSPDYTATSSGATVTITAVSTGTASNGAISTSLGGSSVGGGSDIRYTTSALAGGTNTVNAGTFDLANAIDITQFTGGAAAVSTFDRVDIVPTTLTYAKADSRTDCGSATTCSYDQEMTNFANWYSYYRTRMQMMKTSTSLAFKTIDTRYRVGFVTINSMSANYLPVNLFDGTQKASFYTKLFNAGGTSSTPLRTALSTVGRIFAGKNPLSVANSDPIQYSCQQNFALLTTDGYWNGTGGAKLDGTSMTNYDGTGTDAPMYEGPTATSDTLADAAKYYYDSDLRQGVFGTDAICTGGKRADGTTGDVCTNNVFVTPTDNNVKQHLTTFTLGLGVDGELNYTSDYKVAETGDYFDIVAGTKNWPVPAADKQTAVDDLWHAAVNGQGTYFSAKDPTQLSKSLKDALQALGAKVGAGAAAATSTLNPVAGDNFAYVASYSTVKWTGNLESREIDIVTGEVSKDAVWCIENVKKGSCASPSSIVSEDVNGATVAYCSTPSSTLATCTAGSGIFNGTTNICKVEIASSCVGELGQQVTAGTRNILIKNSTSNNLVPFNYTNLSAAQQSYFNSTWLSTNLSQWSSLTSAQQAVISGTSGGATLVSFLRGEKSYEDRASNVTGSGPTFVDNRLYRFREATLGDALESTPLFIGAPKLDYTDPGYGQASVLGTFKANHASRAGTVFMGTNDGMMHAFNSTTGQERWAYIPSMVIPNMWKLADKDYANKHTNYVNGDPVINDVCVANCTSATNADWRTILVGGLNGGGRGYYALDVTDPTVLPTLLWEFTTTDDADLGITFGNPIITKKADGKWVVLVTSGYNNLPGSNATNAGKGFLYVLDVNPKVTGEVNIISKYSTGEGDATTPSGLAKISAYVNVPDKNNTALYIYGGDLLGNLWRFDINSAAATGTNPFKMAVLKGPTGSLQPITVAPELSDVEGKRLVLVGTGKYLEVSDLVDTSVQSLYAITDDVTSTLINPRLSSTMVKQTLDTSGATRSIHEPAAVPNYSTGRGWYIDLPDSGERQNVAAQLVFGTLLVPTIVPSNTVCSPGGTGWLNFLDYRTGSFVATNVVSTKTNAPIVGINVVYVGGKPKVSIVTADNPTPEFPAVQPSFGSNASNFSNHRVIWRELTDEE